MLMIQYNQHLVPLGFILKPRDGGNTYVQLYIIESALFTKSRDYIHWETNASI
jgi:hypothetical protein